MLMIISHRMPTARFMVVRLYKPLGAGILADSFRWYCLPIPIHLLDLCEP
jgi:hypothetical protein